MAQVITKSEVLEAFRKELEALNFTVEMHQTYRSMSIGRKNLIVGPNNETMTTYFGTIVLDESPPKNPRLIIGGIKIGSKMINLYITEPDFDPDDVIMYFLLIRAMEGFDD